MGMEQSKPVLTPLDPNVDLYAIERSKEEADKRVVNAFASAVGSLTYAAMCTRPDIVYAVHTVAQFTKNPSPIHWQALKRIYKYIQGTLDHGITYGGQGEWTNEVANYTDSDYGSNGHRKSISGYVTLLAGGAISWSSKKQGVTATSTAEAEYVAATHAAKQVIWQRSLFKELGFKIPNTSNIYSDIQAAIAVSKNPEFHARTKHIDIGLHFLRDYVEEEILSLEFVGSRDNVADLFTKGLTRNIHEDKCFGIGVLPGQGGVL
jgi:hypothetical protein